MRVLLPVVLLLFVYVSVQCISEKIITARKGGPFIIASDHGITPIGRTSFTFKIMGCHGAALQLSNSIALQRYFMVMIDMRGHVTSLTDSCFSPANKTVRKSNLLHCNQYKPFWMSWDNTGGFRFGQGLKVGLRTLIDYTSNKPFRVNALSVATTSAPTMFKFLVEEDICSSNQKSDKSVPVLSESMNIKKPSDPDEENNVVVPENTVPGTVILRLPAKVQNLRSTFAYTILSMTDDKGNNDTGPFLIDMKTGHLMTSAALDCDAATGGVKYYLLHIIATDGNHIVNEFVKIKIKNVNDNPPRFDKTMYIISAEDFHKYGLEFDVQDDDEDEVVLTLEKNDYHFFELVKDDKWLLKLRPDRNKREDHAIPSVITVTATDSGSPQRTSQTAVVVTDLSHLPRNRYLPRFHHYLF